MTTESSEIVRNMFNLNKDEKIYDDFGCNLLLDKIKYHGRIYLTENFLCFSSNTFKSNLILPYHDVIELNKSKKNFIILKVKNQPYDKYEFNSFNQFDIFYKRIKNICKAYVLKLSKNSNEKINIILSDSESEDDNDSNSENEFNNNNNNKNNLLEKKNSLNSSINTTNINNINNDNEKKDLITEVKFRNYDKKIYTEIACVTINLPIDEFYNKYQAMEPETYIGKFYDQLEGHSNWSVTDWIKNEENELKRTIKFTMVIKGIPFVNKCDVTREQKLYRDNEGNFFIDEITTNKGIPTADSFRIEIFLEFYKFNNKTVFRIYFYVRFVKTCFIKGVVQNTAKVQTQESTENWLKFIKNHNDNVENYQPLKKKGESSKKLLHGMEKERSFIKNENKFFDKKILKYLMFDIIDFIKKILMNKSNILLILVILNFLFVICIYNKQKKEIEMVKENLNELKNLSLLLKKKRK